jgi:hypothetical protein
VGQRCLRAQLRAARSPQCCRAESTRASRRQRRRQPLQVEKAKNMPLTAWTRSSCQPCSCRRRSRWISPPRVWRVVASPTPAAPRPPAWTSSAPMPRSLIPRPSISARLIQRSTSSLPRPPSQCIHHRMARRSPNRQHCPHRQQLPHRPPPPPRRGLTTLASPWECRPFTHSRLPQRSQHPRRQPLCRRPLRPPQGWLSPIQTAL